MKNLLGVPRYKRTVRGGLLHVNLTPTKKEKGVMLNLTPIGGGHLMFYDAARNHVNFPADGEAGKIVRTICPAAATEVTQRHPVSLVLKVVPALSDSDRARLLQRMDDYVSRSQF